MPIVTRRRRRRRQGSHGQHEVRNKAVSPARYAAVAATTAALTAASPLVRGGSTSTSTVQYISSDVGREKLAVRLTRGRR